MIEEDLEINLLAHSGRELGLDDLIVKNAANSNMEVSGARESPFTRTRLTWF